MYNRSSDILKDWLMKQVFYKLFVNCLYCNNYIDPSLLLVVKKFDRCRISTKIEQEG